MKNLFDCPFRNCFILPFFLVLFLMGNSLSAQERISIKDPDITFHYTLPKGWANQDDEYYHLVFLPTLNGNPDLFPLISITYFENNCPDLEDCFLGQINGGIQESLPNAKIGKTGTTEIAGTKARWVQFTDVETSGPTKTTFNYTRYFFIQNDHYFVLSTKSPEGIDKEGEFIAILKSFHSEKNR